MTSLQDPQSLFSRLILSVSSQGRCYRPYLSQWLSADTFPVCWYPKLLPQIPSRGEWPPPLICCLQPCCSCCDCPVLAIGSCCSPCWAVKPGRGIWINTRLMEARRWKELFLWEVLSSISHPGNWPLCKTWRIKMGVIYTERNEWGPTRALRSNIQKSLQMAIFLFPKYLQAGIWILLVMFKSCVCWVCKNTCGFWLDLFWVLKNLFYYFLPHTHMHLAHSEWFIFLINVYKHIIFTKHASRLQ